MVASVYMPIDQSPPSKELENLIQYCYAKGLPLIIGQTLMHTTSGGVAKNATTEVTSSANAWLPRTFL